MLPPFFLENHLTATRYGDFASGQSWTLIHTLERAGLNESVLHGAEGATAIEALDGDHLGAIDECGDV